MAGIVKSNGDGTLTISFSYIAPSQIVINTGKNAALLFHERGVLYADTASSALTNAQFVNILDAYILRSIRNAAIERIKEEEETTVQSLIASRIKLEVL